MATTMRHDGDIFSRAVLTPFTLIPMLHTPQRRALGQRLPSLPDLQGAGAAMLQKKDELLDMYLSLRAKYKKIQKQYTYCISRRNFFGGKQLRLLSGADRATRCAIIH